MRESEGRQSHGWLIVFASSRRSGEEKVFEALLKGAERIEYGFGE